MKQILVYADSLSWGLVPDTRKRLDFYERWPGVVEGILNATGQRFRIVEDCLNGRRTVWDDPFKDGRNGLNGLGQTIEKHTPLELIIVMLGINDLQSMHPHNAWHSAEGLRRVVGGIHDAPIEPGMEIPPILIVAPPTISTPKGAIAPKFSDCKGKFEGMAEAFRAVATDQGCHFLDAGAVTTVSKVDGVHLDVDQHKVLGEVIAETVRGIL